MAGNTSVDMRKMGVSIVGTLFRTSAINKVQHAKFYTQYFKIRLLYNIWNEK